MRLVSIAALFFLLVLFAACGVARNRLIRTDSDGTIVQQIDCHKEHPQKCHRRAQELCRPFGSEPTVVRPLAYEQESERWILIVTCGPS